MILPGALYCYIIAYICSRGSYSVLHNRGPSTTLNAMVATGAILFYLSSRTFFPDVLGCLFIFLPPYSPDFSPIEESFSCHKCFKSYFMCKMSNFEFAQSRLIFVVIFCSFKIASSLKQTLLGMLCSSDPQKSS